MGACSGDVIMGPENFDSDMLGRIAVSTKRTMATLKKIELILVKIRETS